MATIQTTDDPRKLTTLYRNRNRAPHVIAAKNAATRDYRRQLADAAFGEAARTHVLAQLHAGVPLPEAAAQVHVTTAQVHGRARWDPQFRAALEHALETWSQPFQSAHCGTPTGYRTGCRCRQCRSAHHEETDRYR